LCPLEFRRANAARIEALKAAHVAHPSWATNHRFEMLLMEGIEPAILVQRIAIYRERLKTLVGDDRATVLGQAFGGAANADIDTQRKLSLGLLAEIQRLRHVRSEFERLRNRLLCSLLAAGALFGGAMISLQLVPWLPPVLHVLAAGLLGGYFSVLVKLGALQFCLDYNANYHQVDRLFWNVLWSLCLSMFEGAVGALILHTMFISGLLTGSLFPHFDSVLLDGIDLSKLFWMVPSGSGEAAKLIVWCVVAGFAERLIPDFLSGLARRANAASNADGPRPDSQRPAATL